MKSPTKKELQAMEPKRAAEWVFMLDVDKRNPYDRDSWSYHEFNAEIFKLECESRGY